MRSFVSLALFAVMATVAVAHEGHEHPMLISTMDDGAPDIRTIAFVEPPRMAYIEASRCAGCAKTSQQTFPKLRAEGWTFGGLTSDVEVHEAQRSALAERVLPKEGRVPTTSRRSSTRSMSMVVFLRIRRQHQDQRPRLDLFSPMGTSVWPRSPIRRPPRCPRNTESSGPSWRRATYSA